MPASAQAILETEVRELVRRRGIDPIAEPETVARLIDEVVGDYRDRAITSSLPPMGDAVSASRAVLDAVAGLGPLQPMLDDPSVEEVWINEPGRVFVARHGRSELTNIILTADQVAELVERMLRPTGRRIDVSTPFVDAMLTDGSRLHVVLPNITRRHLAVNIRKFAVGLRLDRRTGDRRVADRAGGALPRGVRRRRAERPGRRRHAGGQDHPVERIVRRDPGPRAGGDGRGGVRASLRAPDVVAMQTRQANLEGTGEIPLRRLVKEALRMRPSRLIVGEVRQEECLDLLIALNSGLPGMCTLHANSAREALIKMCTLAAAGRRERVGGVRRPDRRDERRSRRASRHGRRRAAPGAGDRRRHRPDRGRRHRDHRDLRESARAPRASRRLPAARGPVRAGRHRPRSARSGTAPTGCTRPARADVGALLGLMLGLGRAADLAQRLAARPPGARPRGIDLGATAPRSACGRPASTASARSNCSARRCSAPPSRSCSSWRSPRRSRSPPASPCSRCSCRSVIVRRMRDGGRARCASCGRRPIDNLASAVRAGLSLPEGVGALAVRGPAELRLARSRGSARPTARPGGSASASTRSRTTSPTRWAIASARRCASPAKSAAATSAPCCARCPNCCAPTPAPAPNWRPDKAG